MANILSTPSVVDADDAEVDRLPEDVARIALELPASASAAEIPISWTVESQY